ncbi:HEPN domain-containing protein [bacterium]|nr:HEPN domain-containing protein [bacterium]
MKEYIKYWLSSATHDMDVAETLFQNKKYDWCLFIGHLVLEKILKAFYVSRSHHHGFIIWLGWLNTRNFL